MADHRDTGDRQRACRRVAMKHWLTPTLILCERIDDLHGSVCSVDFAVHRGTTVNADQAPGSFRMVA